jgi:hypothetical protein
MTRARGLHDEGMSIRKERRRHDELRPPTGHKLAKDRWPVQQPKPDPKVTPATDEDQELAKAVIREIGNALTLGMTDDARAAMRDAYRTLLGHGWGEEPAAHLGFLLRIREQARTQEEKRAYTHETDLPVIGGRPIEARTGEEIVALLRANAKMMHERHARPWPTWLGHPRLARFIDDASPVNLGGAGGPLGGKTPETWATFIVATLDAKKVTKRGKKDRRAVSPRNIRRAANS